MDTHSTSVLSGAEPSRITPTMERFVSLFGIVGLLGLAWLLSSKRTRIPLRVIAWGLVLQFGFAALVLKTTPGRVLFEYLRDGFNVIIACQRAGTEFVFGEEFLAQDFVSKFAFGALPTIIFFSALMSVLYYLGVMQWVVRGMAFVMQRTMKTSGAETLSAAANIFVGQTEAPLVIRPYLEGMTTSELMVVMVGGFATVAGSVLAAYVHVFGMDAVHLLTASVISAPAALVVAKLMQPEVEHPKTLGTLKLEAKSEAVNVIHAAAEGAADGVKLAINVAAMLIAFLALLQLANVIVGWVGTWFGYTKPEDVWTIEAALGYVFYPLAWLMGVESGDCFRVGQLLGVKTFANEFVAYEQLSHMIKPGAEQALSPRSAIIAQYALCGFANFGSIGIQIGGIGPLAPSRRGDLARLGLRAMLGGTLAACMTGNVAGVLIG
jgi:CNT family concentrative nucleoside transporter